MKLEDDDSSLCKSTTKKSNKKNRNFAVPDGVLCFKKESPLSIMQAGAGDYRLQNMDNAAAFCHGLKEPMKCRCLDVAMTDCPTGWTRSKRKCVLRQNAV